MSSFVYRPLYIFLLFLIGLFTPALFLADDLNQTDHSGRRQGYWVILGATANDPTYKPNDKVEEGLYKDDSKEGIWKKYWPSGKLRSEITYQAGMPAGFYRLYYENGQTEEQGNWFNQKNTGEFMRFYSNGNRQQLFYFSDNGKRTGLQKYYHENGRLSMEVTVINGIETGTAKRYDANGEWIEEKIFDNGKVVSNGIKTSPIKKTTEPAVVSDPYNDQIGKESTVVSDKPNAADSFRVNGFNILYNFSGQITQTGEFKNGKLCNGKWYRYNDNGLLIRIEIYTNFKYAGIGVMDEK